MEITIKSEKLTINISHELSKDYPNTSMEMLRKTVEQFVKAYNETQHEQLIKQSTTDTTTEE